MVAKFTEKDIARLLKDEGIIRSRAKIEATIGNARAYLAMTEAGEDFSDFVWQMAGGKPIQNKLRKGSEVPAKTELSEEISARLRQHGFKFVGPVITYAWMQAVGMVNDHLVTCFRHKKVR